MDGGDYYDACYAALIAADAEGWGGASFPARLEGWRARLAELDVAGALPRPPARMLELGCGNGMVTQLLAERGYDVLGVDISPRAVAWAQQRFAEARLEGAFVAGDVSQLSLLVEGGFDLVVDGNCLHCLVGDARQRCLEGIAAVLSPGGTCLVSSMLGPPHRDTPGRTYCAETRCLHEDGHAVRYMATLEALRAELAGVGLGVVYEHISRNPWWDHATLVARPFLARLRRASSDLAG